MASVRWRIELLGALSAARGDRAISRFPTQKVAGLLAFLALHPGRDHPREELAERFWPEADAEQGRVSLRTALATLRKQLEPPDVTPGSVLRADRFAVGIAAGTTETDVAEFEWLCREAVKADDPARRVTLLRDARRLYRGELLPGFYDDWVLTERERLAEMHLALLRRLTDDYGRLGDDATAIECAREVVRINPLDELAHEVLIRLCLASGQTTAAQRQYREMERSLRDDLGEVPARSFSSLADEVRGEGPHGPEPTAPEHPARSGPDPQGRVPALPPLPVPLTPFFGREEEIERLLIVLEDRSVRLVTLTGLGGFGKTRLALQVAERLRGIGMPVAFVPLAGVTEPRLIGELICQGLGIPAVSGVDPLGHAIQFMRGYGDRVVLTLDNFEQLVAEGMLAVRHLLESVPSLTCLVTSRIPLDLSCEWEYPVTPLPTPLAPTTPERLLGFPSVCLFAHRARAARPGFGVTEANVQAVARLCHALDGIPLAIELAAARASVLTPEQMVNHMTDRFGFLAGRSRDIEERQRTLRAVLDWSGQALPAGHRKLLARLSIFRGSWSFEAVRAVCDEPDALDCLTDLQHLSFVSAEEHGGRMRYRMLETVREYADSLLPLEERNALAARHLAFYTDLAEDEERFMRRFGQGEAMRRLESEYDNIRAAVVWALENDGRAALRLARAPLWFWQARGYLRDGAELSRSALAHPQAQEPTETRADVLNAAGILTSLSGDFPAGTALIEEALTLSHALAYRRGTSESLNLLGMMAFVPRDFERARPLLEEALAFGYVPGERWYVAPVYLPVIYYDRDDKARAFAVLEDLRRKAAEVESQWMMMASHIVLGALTSEEGDATAATQFLLEALAHASDMGDGIGTAHITREFAVLAVLRGRMDVAARLCGCMEAMVKRAGLWGFLPFRRRPHEVFFDQAREAMGEKAFIASRESGRALTREEAIAYLQETANL
jgi:predicted ATPase/DNA-binding SARP family transcriptional activator